MAVVRARRSGADATGRLRRAARAALFAAIKALTRAAVAVYFRRLRVIHAERLPARGAVLLLANHPATWTDVLVLDVALGRKLHFLAQRSLFDSRFRAALLRIHGALPVEPRPDSPSARERNLETFRQCHELFDRGEVVAVFPEGVSVTDRRVLGLKTGAARIALTYEARIPAGRPLTLVAAGIHYASRTSFGSEVTVSVGEPVAIEPFRARVDSEAAVHALTGRMHRALSALILDLPEPSLAAAVADLESLATGLEAAAERELESARRIATRLDELRMADPTAFERMRRHARAYRRARQALGLGDRSLSTDHRGAAGRSRTGMLIVLCSIGALPAAMGALLHAIPWGIGEAVARRAASEPAQISFARIASGMVLFPTSYALEILGMMKGLRMTPAQAFLAIVGVIALGLWTLSFRRAAGVLLERVRLQRLERSHPRLVARAGSEQRSLLQGLEIPAAEHGRSRAPYSEPAGVP